VSFLNLEVALHWIEKPQSALNNNLQALMMLIVDWQIQQPKEHGPGGGRRIPFLEPDEPED
jgi:hypothetical protein